jgi:hypothetical protein
VRASTVFCECARTSVDYWDLDTVHVPVRTVVRTYIRHVWVGSVCSFPPVFACAFFV